MDNKIMDNKITGNGRDHKIMDNGPDHKIMDNGPDNKIMDNGPDKDKGEDIIIQVVVLVFQIVLVQVF